MPTGLTAAANSSSQVNLSWTSSSDNVGVAGYAIYRNGTQVTTTSGLSYTDTGLSPEHVVQLYRRGIRRRQQLFGPVVFGFGHDARCLCADDDIYAALHRARLATGNHTGLDWTNAWSDIPLTAYSRLDFTKVPLGTTVYVAGSATKMSKLWIDSTNSQSESQRMHVQEGVVRRPWHRHRLAGELRHAPGGLSGSQFERVQFEQ